MKDIIKKYKKNKLKTNINIILSSFLVAILINVFLIDWTSIWKNLKTSVLNSKIENNISDLSIKNQNWTLNIISNKEIQSIENISYSIVYNPANIKIKSIKSNIWEIINISNSNWLNSIIISSDKLKNIKKWDIITSIETKKIENKTENINILNANFKDKDNNRFSLTTSWITF